MSMGSRVLTAISPGPVTATPVKLIFIGSENIRSTSAGATASISPDLGDADSRGAAPRHLSGIDGDGDPGLYVT